MSEFRYELIKECKDTGARLGKIYTRRGVINDPPFLCQWEPRQR